VPDELGCNVQNDGRLTGNIEEASNTCTLLCCLPMRCVQACSESNVVSEISIFCGGNDFVKLPSMDG